MAAALFAIKPLIRPLLAGGFELRVLGLALLVGGGVIVYAAAVFLTRAFTLGRAEGVAPPQAGARPGRPA